MKPTDPNYPEFVRRISMRAVAAHRELEARQHARQQFQLKFMRAIVIVGLCVAGLSIGFVVAGEFDAWRRLWWLFHR